MKELDKYKTAGITEITDEQKQFLLKAREGNKKITWEKITELWVRVGWGKKGETTIRRYYKQLKV